MVRNADLKAILEALKESNCFEAVSPRWPDSVASLPSGEIAELRADEITRCRRLAGIDEDERHGTAGDDALLATASAIRQSSALSLLFWHAVQTCYSYREVPWDAFATWPSLKPVLGESAPVFYLLLGLAMIPRAVVRHRELGIPEEVTRQTLRGPLSSLRRFQDGNDGKPGFFRRDVGWFRFTTEGELYRLGRFEYMHRTFREPFHAYRNVRNGRVVLLAAHGSRFTSLGYADARPSEGEPGWWEAHRIIEDCTVRGFPIDPRGRAIPREIAIDRNEWREVVVPNETSILDVHIPVGGGMTPAVVQSSFRDAISFFERCFPSKPFAGFRCGSWILGPQLENIFPPDANLVRLLREVYLYPVVTQPFAGLFFVFSDETLDDRSIDRSRLAGLPERTTLRVRVKRYVLAGNPWRAGGMLFLREDLDTYGTGFYRRHPPPGAAD